MSYHYPEKQVSTGAHDVASTPAPALYSGASTARFTQNNETLATATMTTNDNGMIEAVITPLMDKMEKAEGTTAIDSPAHHSPVLGDDLPPSSPPTPFPASSTSASCRRPGSSRLGGLFPVAVPQLSKYGLGVFLILCVTVIWVASSEWIQFIFGMLHFDKPFFLTYFNTSGFALWNLGYWLKPSWREVPWDDEEIAQPIHIEDPAFTYLLLEDVKQRLKQKLMDKETCAGDDDDDHNHHNEEEDTVHVVDNGEAIQKAFQERLRTDEAFRQWCMAHDSCYDYGASSPTSGRRGFPEGHGDDARVGPAAETVVVEGRILEEDFEESDMRRKTPSADVEVVLESTPASHPVRVRVHAVRPYSAKRIWKAAALFCPFWFLANYLFNLSLSYTSVSSNTIMSAMGTVWTVVISRVFLSVPIGPYKLAGVAICISGSMIVSLSSSSDNGSSMLGNTIALLSSFFYAVYTFVLRWCLPDDDRYSMGQVFGAVGVINMAVLWIGFPLLHYIGLEPFSFPSLEQFLPLLVNALIGTNLSDVLWARSVILTSPVVATLGLSLTTPLSMVVDAILHGSYYPVPYVLGAMCVLAGFVVANIR